MKHVDDIRALIDLLVTSKDFHSLVIEGPPGWGKSSSVELALTEKQRPFKTLGSYSTPLRLFLFLSENADKLLVIDDCAGIFGDPVAMSILKAATWPSSGTEGARLVCWGSSSDRIQAKEFFFEGKIIILTNSLPSRGDGSAFSSRSLHYSIVPSISDMENFILEVSKTPAFPNGELANEAAKHLLECGRASDFSGVNLRTLRLGYELAASGRSDWKAIFTRLLPKPDQTRLAFSLASETNGSVEQQYREFHRATGLSRRTFFYYRSRVGRTAP